MTVAALFRKRRLRWIFWTSTLLIAALIFLFSAQDKEASGELSGQVTRQVIRLVYPAFEDQPPDTQLSIFSLVSQVVRKGAHFIEFLLLGTSLRLLLATYSLRFRSGIAWLAGTLYAVSDEVHQWLGGTRAGMWQDVALDSAGVLTGIGIAWLVLTHLARRAAREEKSGTG